MSPVLRSRAPFQWGNKPISHCRYFPRFSETVLTFNMRYSFWQVSTLFNCSETYQIRIWFSQSHRACSKSRNIHKGWINERVLGRLFSLHQVRVDCWLVPLEYRLFAWSKHSHVIVPSLLNHKGTSYQRVIRREWPNTCMWMRWGASFTNRVELRWHLLLCVKCDYASMS